MKRNLVYLAVALVFALSTSSCKKDNAESGLKAVFSYVADGYRVNFTNFSTDATEYMWEFGDGSGETSASKTPQHVFTRKGDFLVSLTAKNGTESSVFTDTVSILGPNIKIDGDYSDWEYVAFSHENAAGYPSSILGVKTFATSQTINFYLEGTAAMNMEIIDIYVDADNNPATGFSTWLYPAGSGADFLCEGSPVGGWGDVFKHVGAPTAFSFTPVATFAAEMNFSSVSTVAGKKIIEFSIKKTALGPVSNFINFAIIESTSGWAEVGKIPEYQTPASKFIAVPL